MDNPITVPIQADPITIQVTGSVTIPPSSGTAPTQRGLDAVADLGMDPTGENDCSPILSSYLESNSAVYGELHFPPGSYYFQSTVETNQTNVCLLGDGSLANMNNASVVFFTDRELDSILWWNGSKKNSNMNGPRIENIQFQDVTRSRLRSCIRLTATANSELKIGLQNLAPQRYVEGTVSAQTNSKIVTGLDTEWETRMAPCGWIVINGYPYEIASIENTTSLTLAINYQGSDIENSEYAINWGGIGVWCEPGSDFTQYGKNWSINGRCGCALFASAGATSPKFTGTSRIKVRSGYINGEGIPDSIGCYLGPYSDTFVWDVAMNSYAYGVVIANGHQHDIQHVDIENAGPPPPVTGKPLDHDSCYGVLIMSDNNNDGWGNRIGGYFRQCGTAIELYGQPGKAPNWTVIAIVTFRSNKANFINGNGSNTQVLIQTSLFEFEPDRCE